MVIVQYKTLALSNRHNAREKHLLIQVKNCFKVFIRFMG
jgi:hypothetical protein